MTQQSTPDAEISGDQIQRLLSGADRLGFGVRRDGFVLINRARLIENEGISRSNAKRIDEWVTGAGGGLQRLQREDPATAPKRYQRIKRIGAEVWEIPADALGKQARA
jgi:isopentenyl phosphate kinase